MEITERVLFEMMGRLYVSTEMLRQELNRVTAAQMNGASTEPIPAQTEV